MKRQQEKIARHLKLLFKRFGPYLGRKSGIASKPIFILGYGRSGTSMLLDAFSHDMRIQTVGENDPRIASHYMLVLENITPVITASRSQSIVFKPILDSFSAKELLTHFPDAKIVWVIRNFQDVVSSANKKFGDRVAIDMKNLVMSNEGNNWLTKGVPTSLLCELRTLPIEEFDINDWMGLVWYAVNSTIARDDLLENEHLLLVRYENLVTRPDFVMRQIYDFIGLSFRAGSTKYMNSASIGKGQHIELHPQVHELCDTLHRALN